MKYFSCLIALILLQSCQIFTLHFSDEDTSYSEWARREDRLMFVSSKMDTAIYTIIDINEFKDQSNNPIESGGTFFSAANTRIISYQKQTKDTIYNGTLFRINKNGDYPASVTMEFESCCSDLRNKQYNQKYNFKGNLFDDIAIFDPNNRDQDMIKIWWSKSIGPLKYQMRDSTIWKRINY